MDLRNKFEAQKMERITGLQHVNLYIKNLEDDIDNERLHSEFSLYGDITSAKVMKDDKGKSKGFGFVCFKSPDHAKEAVAEMHGRVLVSNPLHVVVLTNYQGVNLSVKNLEDGIDDERLHSEFSPYGNLTSAKVMKDDKGKSKGFGFVCYLSIEEARKAALEMNNKVLVTKPLHVALENDKNINLYIKNLEDCIDDERLYSEFSPYGVITSSTVMRNDEGKSKGFGFVCFSAPGEARRAISKMNGRILVTKPLFVAFAEYKEERRRQLSNELQSLCPVCHSMYVPEKKQQQNVNLYIKNLADIINDERLYSEFSPYGTITSAKVMLNDEGKSKGFGFVCFSSPEEATRAFTKMNGKVLVTKTLYVAFAEIKEKRRLQMSKKFVQNRDASSCPRLCDPDQKQGNSVNLYIKNLEDGIDEEMLISEFSPYGNITSVKVMKDSHGKPKGFGFVCFATHEEAIIAFSKMNGRILVTKPLYVGFAEIKEERRRQLSNELQSLCPLCHSMYVPEKQNVNLYIKNLENVIDNDRLYSEFSPYGTITSAKVMRDDNGKSKGFGFVCFSSPEEATEAISKMDGAVLITKRLYVVLAQRKEERRQIALDVFGES